jgi:hypothetical protein
MGLFVSLVVPMPFTVKRKLFNFIAESPLVAKLQYGLKVCVFPVRVYNRSDKQQITFIFILILFLDSVNRVYRVQVEMSSLMKDSSGVG